MAIAIKYILSLPYKEYTVKIENVYASKEI